MLLRPRLLRSFSTGLLGAALSFGILQCSVTPLGATDSGIAKARVASPPGADAFDRECASCHGKQGEGLTIAPAVMGTGALAEFPRSDASSSDPAFATSAPVQGDSAHVPGQAKRAPFHNAQDVYDYVSSRMPLPKSASGTLKPEEYWAIVNYMLVANGVAVPADGVTEANAKSVALR